MTNSVEFSTVERGGEVFISFGGDSPPVPNVLERLSKRVDAQAQTIPSQKKEEPQKSSLSRAVQFVRDWTSIADVNDIGQAIVRNVAGQVQKAVSKNPSLARAIGAGNKISAAVCGAISVVTKGVAFSDAIAKLPTAFKYGNLYDKLDALLAFLRTLLAFSSSSIGLTSTIAGDVVLVIIAVPLLVIKILSMAIWVIRALVRITRISLAISEVNHAMQNSNDKEKLLTALKMFKDLDVGIELENQAILSKETKPSEGLKTFLKERKSVRLARHIGTYAEKLVYTKFDGKTTYDTLIDDLNRLEEKMRAADTIDDFDALAAEEEELINEGLAWVKEIQDEMIRNRLNTVPILIASVAAIVAIALGAVASPGILAITALSVGLLSQLSWGSVGLIGLGRKYGVLDNHKKWMSHIIVKALAQEIRSSQDPSALAAKYGFKAESGDDFVKEFKVFMRKKIEAKQIENKMGYNLLARFKELSEKEEITSEMLWNLREDLKDLIDSLVEEDKERVAREHPLYDFLQNLKSSHIIKDLSSNLPRGIHKQHKRVTNLLTA